MALVFCPTCGQQFESKASTARPFCSARCRWIDLGRWLNEEHRLPIEPEDEEMKDEGSEIRCEEEFGSRSAPP